MDPLLQVCQVNQVCIFIFAYKTLCFRNRYTTVKTNFSRYYLQVNMLKEVYLLHKKII